MTSTGTCDACGRLRLLTELLRFTEAARPWLRRALRPPRSLLVCDPGPLFASTIAGECALALGKGRET
jgi:hypothetical protein